MDYYNLPLSAYTPGQGNPSMEGGYETASGAPMYTFEDWLAGRAPYVTGAVTGARGWSPSGQIVNRTIGGMQVPVGLTDRGPGVGGSTLDIAYSNPGYATNYPYQGQTNSGGMSPYQGFNTAYAQAPQNVATYGREGNYGQMSTLQDYYHPQPSTTDKTVGAIGTGLQSVGSMLMQSGSGQGQQQALAMLQQPQQKDQLDYYADNPLAALMQLYQLTGMRG